MILIKLIRFGPFCSYRFNINSKYIDQFLMIYMCIYVMRNSSIYYITVTSQWVRWRLKSPTSWLFTQPSIQAEITENIKAPRHRPLCGNHWWPVNSPHKSPVTRKWFPFDDVIMMNWYQTYMRKNSHSAFHYIYDKYMALPLQNMQFKRAEVLLSECFSGC